jgi:hypothetical protein
LPTRIGLARNRTISERTVGHAQSWKKYLRTDEKHGVGTIAAFCFAANNSVVSSPACCLLQRKYYTTMKSSGISRITFQMGVSTLPHNQILITKSCVHRDPGNARRTHGSQRTRRHEFRAKSTSVGEIE